MQVVHSEETHDRDYLMAAVDTALDIHLHQPPGDILVFLSGQAEIEKAPALASAAASAAPGHSHLKVLAHLGLLLPSAQGAAAMAALHHAAAARPSCLAMCNL